MDTACTPLLTVPAAYAAPMERAKVGWLFSCGSVVESDIACRSYIITPLSENPPAVSVGGKKEKEKMGTWKPCCGIFRHSRACYPYFSDYNYTTKDSGQSGQNINLAAPVKRNCAGVGKTGAIEQKG